MSKKWAKKWASEKILLVVTECVRYKYIFNLMLHIDMSSIYYNVQVTIINITSQIESHIMH